MKLSTVAALGGGSVVFPAPVQVRCDPNPADDQVTAYHFRLDGAAVGASPRPSLKVLVPAPGTHTFGVSAVNVWGESPVTTVSAKINPAGKPTNVHVVKG